MAAPTLPLAPGDMSKNALVTQRAKSSGVLTTIGNVTGSLGSQLALSNVLNWLAPGVFTGWLSLPITIMLQLSGIPNAAGKTIYNVLKWCAGRGEEDKVLVRAAEAVASSNSDIDVTKRDELRNLLAEISDTKRRIDVLADDVSAKKIP